MGKELDFSYVFALPRTLPLPSDLEACPEWINPLPDDKF